MEIDHDENPPRLFSVYGLVDDRTRLRGWKTFTLSPVRRNDNGAEVFIKLLENEVSLMLTWYMLKKMKEWGGYAPDVRLVRVVCDPAVDYKKALEEHPLFALKYAKKIPLLEAKPAGRWLVLESEVIQGCNMSDVRDIKYKDMPVECVLSLVKVMLQNKWFGAADMCSTNIMLHEVEKRFVRIDCSYAGDSQVLKFNKKRLQTSQRIRFGTYASAAVRNCVQQQHVAIAEFIDRMRDSDVPKHPLVTYWLFDDAGAREALRHKNKEALEKLCEDILCKREP